MKPYLVAMTKLEAKFKKTAGRQPATFRVHPDAYKQIERFITGAALDIFPVNGDSPTTRSALYRGIEATLTFRGVRIVGDPDIQPDTVACGIYYRTVAAK